MAFLLPVYKSISQERVPFAGMQINQSVRLQQGEYLLKADVDNKPIIEISGHDLVVDFNNCTIRGNEAGTMPDAFTGVALRITGGSNITIKNLHVHGYKIALLATGVTGLHIEHCDLSYNYRQRLYSTQRKEDLSDWMSYHHNENDEWMRYGAAIYLRKCNAAVISENEVMGGQCALMMTECDSSLVTNNNFSFNSGLGIGMYRSSDNQVLQNRLDFNVRGHSEGVYNRGQDAAAILVFEQCNKNLFALNSATHSGDGFFLWAGQTTMDSGRGGCNDNTILQNDFSYAPTNGVEVTFSSNTISSNRIEGCDNGIWGGYSYHTKIRGNYIVHSTMGIAIEHGQENEIDSNFLFGNKTALKLWGRASQPADWGYARFRDTRSRDYSITGNSFLYNRLALDLSRTDGLQGNDNDSLSNEQWRKIDSTVKQYSVGFRRRPQFIIPEVMQSDERYLKRVYPYGKRIPSSGESVLPRSAIRMLEWGPYDYQSPLLWNTNPVAANDTLFFDVLGPAGKWRLKNMRGIKSISAKKGSVPGSLYAIRSREAGQDVYIEMDYAGKTIVTPMGERISAGRSYPFNYRNAELPVNWTTKWFGYDSSHNPIENPGFLRQVESVNPVATDSSNELRYAWWSGAGKEAKTEQFVTLAEAAVQLPEGDYVLGVSWDDVIRIAVDGKLVMDEWRPLDHVYDESPHREVGLKLGGTHQIRVEHANKSGFATLIVTLKKK